MWLLLVFLIISVYSLFFLWQASNSEHCSSKPLLSTVSVTSVSAPIQLEQIAPANRSNLSNNQHFSLTRQCSRDFSQYTLQASKSTRTTQHQENKVIDLTSDDSYHEQQVVNFIAQCSAKRPKISKIHSDIVKRQCSSSMQLCKADLSHSPSEASTDCSSGICCKEISPLSACEPAYARRCSKDRGTQHAQVDPITSRHELDTKIGLPPKNNEDVQSSALPCGDTTARGSAFLVQVEFFLVVF